MKHFVRSTAGKAILILLILLCTAGIFASAAAGYYAVEEELYGKTEAQVIDDLSISDCSALAFHYFDSSYTQTRSTGVRGFEIRIEKAGEYIGGSTGYASMEAPVTRFVAVVSPADGNRPWPSIFYFGEPEGAPVYEHTEVYDILAKYDKALISTNPEPRIISIIYAMRYWLWAVLAGSIALALIFFAVLMSVSGKRPGDEELHTGLTTGLPFDAELLLYLALVGLFFGLLEDGFGPAGTIFLLASGFLVCGSLGLLLSMDFAVKCKLRRLFSGLLTVRTVKWVQRLCRSSFRFCGKVIAALPLVWRTALIVGAVCFMDLIVTASSVHISSDFYVFWWGMLHLLVGGGLLYLAYMLRRLQKGGKELANGNLSYRTDTKGLLWEFKTHAENLNALSGTVARAAAQATKSERMKTELITNVSHDIKTPLTSIINYASLIAEECEGNEKLKEHSEVLVRQSNKLKRLLEDLVDASRASSGSLDIQPTPCDAAVFITQAAGEYMDRLAAAGLSLVTKVPEKEVLISADPRRMQRVFDNLLSNACKYSAPGTRVYLTLEQVNSTAIISFKNTSRNELDISPEELMERFVRGDNSRSTEGSGLGLSIAKSLIELQGGALNLNIDGDLFKVFLVFPAIGE